jgi:hypothetical protein
VAEIKIFLICHNFAEDNATFVVRYVKELLQILHLATGDSPEQRTFNTGPNQTVVAAEFSE